MHNRRSFTAPEQLKLYPSWVVWGAPGSTGDERKIPYSARRGTPASVTDATTWSDFETAAAFANQFGFEGLGFVLSSNDPFAFIDLDDPEGDPLVVAQQTAIFERFKSYAEISPSGKGLHIIVQADIPRGRRRNKIEIYSRARYMTVTGNVYRSAHIMPLQQEAERLFVELGGVEPEKTILEEDDIEEFTDEEILERARSARNGEKFELLFVGKWEELYPTQSEADFALINILAFYSKSKTQIVRLYHKSGLVVRQPGKDPNKAYRRDYLEWMLNRCFDQILPPVDLSYLKEGICRKVEELKLAAEAPSPLPTIPQDVYSFPPGLVGDIASFIYEQAPRPVKEIALTAALGFMSGLVGRSYNVSSSGLNQYYLLLAPTGTGKEAMSSGINKIVSAVRPIYPAIGAMIGPGEIASSQGLIKYLNGDSKCFLSILGEFGLALKEMADRNASPTKIGLRRILLDLYNKSGKGQELRPIIYSDKEKNTKAVPSPAVTLLGESTPERFYEALDDNMIAEGLLPRFLSVEYRGPRPPMNYGHSIVKPSNDLVQKVASLASQCAAINARNDALDIKFTQEADEALANFNDACDNAINCHTADEVTKQLWNRAHIKVLKVASLVAIGLNPYEPRISLENVLWAKGIVVKDCENIANRFKMGEVGTFVDERTQLRKIAEVFRDFVTRPMRDLYAYSKYVNNIEAFHADHVVPYPYIQRRLLNVKEFKFDKYQKPSEAIKKALKTLQDMGEIEELPVIQRRNRYGANHAAFVIRNPSLLDDDYLCS